MLLPPPLRGLQSWRMGQYQHLPDAASPAYVALDLFYVSWSKLGVPARRGTCIHHHFPCRKIIARWQIVIVPPLSLLDYSTWGLLQAKGNAMAHPKMGSLKHTIWHLWAAKIQPCCGKIAAHAGCSWRVVAVGAGYSDSFSNYCPRASFKTIFWA